MQSVTRPKSAQLDITRRLIDLRRKSLPLIYGDMVTLALTDKVWVYMRVYMGEWVITAVNTGGEPQNIACVLPESIDLSQPLMAHFGNSYSMQTDGVLTLNIEPYGFEILTTITL